MQIVYFLSESLVSLLLSWPLSFLLERGYLFTFFFSFISSQPWTHFLSIERSFFLNLSVSIRKSEGLHKIIIFFLKEFAHLHFQRHELESRYINIEVFSKKKEDKCRPSNWGRICFSAHDIGLRCR